MDHYVTYSSSGNRYGDHSNVLLTGRGVRQGVRLARLFYNLGFQKPIRDSGIQTSKASINVFVQLLGYADDIEIAGRPLIAVKDVQGELK